MHLCHTCNDNSCKQKNFQATLVHFMSCYYVSTINNEFCSLVWVLIEIDMENDKKRDSESESM